MLSQPFLFNILLTGSLCCFPFGSNSELKPFWRLLACRVGINFQIPETLRFVFLLDHILHQDDKDNITV